MENLADIFLKEGNFKAAFDLYNNMYLDGSLSDEERAEAANMMGVVILFDPSVDSEDESGLKYYKKALELNSKNLSALLNIISNFGNSVNNHTDLEIVNFAFSQLKLINYTMSEYEYSMFQDKLKNFHKRVNNL